MATLVSPELRELSAQILSWGCLYGISLSTLPFLAAFVSAHLLLDSRKVSSFLFFMSIGRYGIYYLGIILGDYLFLKAQLLTGLAIGLLLPVFLSFYFNNCFLKR